LLTEYSRRINRRQRRSDMSRLYVGVCKERMVWMVTR
jgi:hypothetical protein